MAQLSHDDIDLKHLPDTGSLRGDMLAMIRPFDDHQQQMHIQVVVGLLTLITAEGRLAAAATGAGIGQFTTPVDLQTLAELIPMLCVSRAAQRLPIDRAFGEGLMDSVIIPALRGTPTTERSTREKERTHARQRPHPPQRRR